MKRSTLTIMLMLLLLTSMPASATMTHRWDFAAGTTDVVGGLQGTLVDTAYVSGGSLVLDGTEDILQMDAGGIAANTYSAITMEMWYTPTSGANTGNTMLAYLGGNNSAATWMGINHLFMCTARADNTSRAAISCNNTTDPWTTETGVSGTELDDGLKHHMAVSVDATQLSFYIDGEFIGTAALSANNHISNISNDLALLGRGGYLNDPEWNGSIQEFRIYDKALTPTEIAYSYLGGENSPRALVIRSTTPAYGQTLVSTSPTLSWTLETSITADSFNLYYGTDPNIADPNRADVSGISTAVTGLTSASYAITSPLSTGTDYYWRVDTVAGATTYQGAGNVFTTVPPTPVFSTNPGHAYVFPGQDAVMSATCQSTGPWTSNVQWFKVGSPDTEVVTGGDVTIVTQDIDPFTKTSTLTIITVEPADEGSYYAKVANISGSTQSTAASVVIKTLLAHYEFEGDATDSSGNGMDGTILTPSGAAATATYVSSMTPAMGQAILFSGAGISNPSNTTDPYVDLPDGFSDFSRGLTISAWINPTSTAAWQRILQFGNGTNAGNNSFYFTRNASTTQVRFENDNTNPSSATRLTAGNDTFVNNVWQMLTVTLNTDATNNAVIYRNGVAVATGTVTLPNVITRTHCYLGRSEWDGDYLFRGLMDDVEIYNYPRSAEEVALAYLDATPEDDYICLPGSAPLAYDVNADCRVNLTDILALSQLWMECDRYPVETCNW